MIRATKVVTAFGFAYNIGLANVDGYLESNAMTKELREHGKFLRTIGLILLWGMGIVPLCSLFILGTTLMLPYVSVVSTVAAIYILRHARKYISKGDVDDRGY